MEAPRRAARGGRSLLGRLRAPASGGSGGAPAGLDASSPRSPRREKTPHRPVLGLALVALLLLLLSDNGRLSRALRGWDAEEAESAPHDATLTAQDAPRTRAALRPQHAGRASMPPAPRRARLADEQAVAVAAAIAASRVKGGVATQRASPPPAGDAGGALAAALEAARAAAAAVTSGAGGGAGGAGASSASAALAAAAPSGPPGLLHTNLPASDPDAPLPPLSAELLAAYSNPVPGQSRRAVVMACTDYKPGGSASQAAQARMTLNWVRTVRSLNLSCLVGVCEERNPQRRGVAALADADACGFFHAPRRECVVNPRVGRWYYVSDVAALSYDVLSSDPDVVLFRDPLPYLGSLFRAHPNVDVLASTDSNNGIYTHPGGRAAPGGQPSADGHAFHAILPAVSALPPAPPTRWQAAFPGYAAIPQGYVARPEHSWRDGPLAAFELAAKVRSGEFEIGLEDPGNCNPHQYNSGFMYWRATARSAELLRRWRLLLDQTAGNPSADDQLPVNHVMKNASAFCATLPPASDAIAAAMNSGVCGGDRLLNTVAGGAGCLGLLNLVQFANGFVFCTARAHEQHGARPFALHATYAGDKLLKLREEGVFMDEPSYYDGGERFLSYDVDLPRRFFHANLSVEAPDGFYTWRTHWSLVQHQLVQLRAALALASALGRVLVLPRVACTCECFFYPGRDCVIEGHRVRLPHVCPTDHWLKPGRLTQRHREPGFLDNPRLPAAVRDARAVLDACAPGDACGAGIDAAAAVGPSAPAVLLPRGGTDAALRERLAPLAGARVLHLAAGAATALFGGFAEAADASAFNASLAGVLSAWCCLKEHPDGKPHPGVEVWKIPYKWEGEPEPVDGSTLDVGKCGA